MFWRRFGAENAQTTFWSRKWVHVWLFTDFNFEPNNRRIQADLICTTFWSRKSIRQRNGRRNFVVWFILGFKTSSEHFRPQNVAKSSPSPKFCQNVVADECSFSLKSELKLKKSWWPTCYTLISQESIFFWDLFSHCQLCHIQSDSKPSCNHSTPKLCKTLR